MNRRDLLIMGAGVALSTRATAQKRGAKRPNVVFILADDLGYADLSCYGRRDYRTPRLDRLAREGLMMSSGYANSAVCSASRTALITGRYQYRLPVGLFEPIGGGDVGLPDNHPTLPSLMKQQGYRTSLFGKWHLGNPPQHSPIHHGYDYFFGFMGGASDYFRNGGRQVIAAGSGPVPPLSPPTGPGPRPAGGPPQSGCVAPSIPLNNPSGAPGALPFPPGGPGAGPPPGLDAGGDALSGGLYEGDTPVTVPGYLTDLLADRAAKEIESCARADQPFFISLHFNAPHWPWEGPGDEEASKSITNLMHEDGGNLRKYAEMVVAMDAAIGRVLDQIRRSGVERDTIVIFTSDNGGERFSDDWPFIGVKGELLEGGVRIPLIVRWPARIKGGSRSDQVMIHMDWLPTLLAAAGGAPDPAYPSDGMNLLPVLAGEQPPFGRKLFWRYKAAEQAALRENEWKYLRIGGNEYLFNIAEDERERANHRRTEPERFERLKREWNAWNAGMLPYPEVSTSYGPKSSCWADRY